MQSIKPAVFSTKEAWLYVGGRPFFEELLQAYPDILKPVRESRNEAGARTKSQYLRTILDTALKAAQLSQSFVTPAASDASQLGHSGRSE